MSSMTEDKTYNGWANYPTWAVNLWLSNDEGLYNTTRELIADAAKTERRYPFTAQETVRYEAAESIKNFVCDYLAPDLGASFAADLLGFALGEVDWLEIADDFIEHVNED